MIRGVGKGEALNHPFDNRCGGVGVEGDVEGRVDHAIGGADHGPGASVVVLHIAAVELDIAVHARCPNWERNHILSCL